MYGIELIDDCTEVPVFLLPVSIDIPLVQVLCWTYIQYDLPNEVLVWQPFVSEIHMCYETHQAESDMYHTVGTYRCDQSL